MRAIFCLLILCALGQEIFPQAYSTRDSYTGNREDLGSWDPVGAVLIDTISGIDTYINGYITAEGSIDISGTACTLTVNDTLDIRGDMSLGNIILMTK